MKKRLISANWKMHKTVQETEEFLKTFLKICNPGPDREVLIFPPFTSLPAAVQILKNSPIKLGAQNCHWEKKGAFTGEISPVMLRDLGCEYVIIGHSERRHIFGEEDEILNKKLISALEEGLRPVLCVGEKIEDREAGMTEKVIETQLRLGLSRLENHIDRIDVAYEPVWAIGTGVPATPEDAVKVHRFINKVLDSLNPSRRGETRILYGGSVKPSNASEFMKHDEIEGLLVGGASLDPESFAQIVNSF